MDKFSFAGFATGGIVLMLFSVIFSAVTDKNEKGATILYRWGMTAVLGAICGKIFFV